MPPMTLTPLPAMSRSVHLHGSLTHAQIQRLLRVADTCPVKHALEAGFLIRQRLAQDQLPSLNRAA